MMQHKLTENFHTHTHADTHAHIQTQTRTVFWFSFTPTEHVQMKRAESAEINAAIFHPENGCLVVIYYP